MRLAFIELLVNDWFWDPPAPDGLFKPGNDGDTMKDCGLDSAAFLFEAVSYNLEKSYWFSKVVGGLCCMRFCWICCLDEYPFPEVSMLGSVGCLLLRRS